VSPHKHAKLKNEIKLAH